MNHRCIILGLAAALVFGRARQLHAQVPADTAASQPRHPVDSLTAAIRVLEARIDSLARVPLSTPPTPQPRASGAYMNLSFVGLTDAGWSTAARYRCGRTDVASIGVRSTLEHRSPHA